MAGTKEELRAKIKQYEEKILAMPNRYKGFWRRQLKAVKKQLYGSF